MPWMGAMLTQPRAQQEVLVHQTRGADLCQQCRAEQHLPFPAVCPLLMDRLLSSSHHPLLEVPRLLWMEGGFMNTSGVCQ